MIQNRLLSEFEIIDSIFNRQSIARPDVLLGIGDDAALLSFPLDQMLAVSVDTLIENVHFPASTAPYDIGYKSLAVNLSDLAAMGADPAWFTLALSIPQNDNDFLTEFSAGLFALAKQFNVQLIGGDTARGPLSVTVNIHGFVPPKQALKRTGAKKGDKIYVSGSLGDAGLGLKVAMGEMSVLAEHEQFVLARLCRPTPRVQLGKVLRGVASSAIDISDGLLADLDHILKVNKLGAEIVTEKLPLSEALNENLAHDDAVRLALSAGDDYELCFTVSPDKEDALQTLLQQENISCTCVGEVIKSPGIRLVDFEESIEHWGYQHFL